MIWGTVLGGLTWYWSVTSGIPAKTGTIILALLPLLLGWTSIIQALVLDVNEAGPCILFDFDDDSLLPPAEKKRDHHLKNIDRSEPVPANTPGAGEPGDLLPTPPFSGRSPVIIPAERPVAAAFYVHILRTFFLNVSARQVKHSLLNLISGG